MRKNFIVTDEENIMKALYKTELEGFLNAAGIKDEFYGGTLKCRYCNIAISQENLHAFIPDGDHFDFCCSNVNCILNLSEESSNANNAD